jgi:hypothetical protein
MPRRKSLQSVVHSVAHSFLSPMNCGTDGYVIEHLVKVAVRRHIDMLTVDLLSGAYEPEIWNRTIAKSIAVYSKGLPTLVHSSGSDMKFVRSAKMVLSGLTKALQTHWLPAGFHYRVTCAVQIISDENRKYVATLTEMWPGPPPRLKGVSNSRDA